MKLAESEKDRLETKQRAVRKQNEKNGIKHVPAYFYEEHNPEQKLTYFKYNNKYFEEDKKNKDWKRLPDLYSNNIEQ